MDVRDISIESRIERKKRETREKIVKISMNLFQDQGFNNTTMEQIAEKTDIARKTLYNYFPVKEAIVDEYVKGISQKLAGENLETIWKFPNTKSRLVASLNHTYSWVESNKEIMGICMNYRLRNMCNDSKAQNAETGTQSILNQIISRGQETGEIRKDISVKLLVTHINILRSAMTFEWVNSTSRFEIHDEIAKMVDLFLYGADNRLDSSKKSELDNIISQEE
jgi:AcrR family transcriptional regulator